MIEDAGFEVLPPAKRGDIEQIAAGSAGIIVLVDGLFNQSRAVGHAELRRALERGWDVWGLSSMGAIRAFEMRFLGMRGYGQVYEHFLNAEDFSDDEMALLHSSAYPYRAFTEPLVHIRHCLATMQSEGEIAGVFAQAVVDELKAMWFGHRTLDAFSKLVSEHAGAKSGGAASGRIQEFEPFQVKTLDLVDFFRESIWSNGQYTPIPRPAPYSLGARASLGLTEKRSCGYPAGDAPPPSRENLG